MRRSHILAAALLLTIVAAPPRLLELNELSFYADEETTAFPARALAEDGRPVMPSGMPYLRAAPLTWLNALSARALGVDAEASYRLPTALIGTLTVPVFFLLGARLLGPGPALVAALLLAGSEWHILFSRQARMYAPMMGFAIAAAAAILAWVKSGRRRDLFLGFGLFAVAVSLHVLAALVLVFALLPIVVGAETRPRPASLVAFAALGAVWAVAYLRLVETAGFRVGDFAHTMAEPGESLVRTWLAAVAAVPVWRWPLTLAGAVSGAWLAARAWRALPEPFPGARRLAHLASGLAAGALVGAGHVYGAGLAGLVFLLLAPAPAWRTMRAAAAPSALLGIIALASATGAIASYGLVEGAKSLLRFPFPYFVPLARQSYGVAALFAGAAIWMALAQDRPEHRGLRMNILAVVVGFAAIGAAQAWGSTRFLLPLYPFYLLAAAAALVAGAQWAVGVCAAAAGWAAAAVGNAAGRAARLLAPARRAAALSPAPIPPMSPTSNMEAGSEAPARDAGGPTPRVGAIEAPGVEPGLGSAIDPTHARATGPIPGQHPEPGALRAPHPACDSIRGERPERASVRAARPAPGWFCQAHAALGLGVAAVVAVSGVLGGHGVPQARHMVMLRHGEPVQATMHMVPFRPDHAAPGRFVAERRRPGDVVIAEDPLQQRWYAGPVDFWLRSFADGRQFVYRAPDGALRDIYVNSQILRDVALVDSLLTHAAGRVWVITSGETYGERDYYLDDAQRRWLDSLEATLAPAFTGRDGVTRVYCLNCPSGAPARTGAPAPPLPAVAPAPSDTR